ncbi:hypothetical protein P2318_00090 [Myxococcaceae bacterium GXIMD 01537]
MKWRALLAMAAGLLLTVPLAFAVGTSVYPPDELTRLRNARVRPMLTWAEASQRVTFLKACHVPADCEEPLGCMRVNPGDPSYCFATECMTDLQCDEGFACRAFSTVEGGPLVRVCAPIGKREEGQPCLQGLGLKRHTCGEGLVCAAWCGRRCELGAPASCPEGFFCAEGPEGPSCRPTCAGRTCPEGQQCISFEDGASVCAEVRGQDCQRTPCAEGLECKRYFPRVRPEGLVLGMACVQPCGDGKPPCPEGLLCASGECRRPCGPDAGSACGPDEVCKRNAVEGRWLCQLRVKP